MYFMRNHAARGQLRNGRDKSHAAIQKAVQLMPMQGWVPHP
jgi:hypothetical protein